MSHMKDALHDEMQKQERLREIASRPSNAPFSHGDVHFLLDLVRQLRETLENIFDGDCGCFESPPGESHECDYHAGKVDERGYVDHFRTIINERDAEIARLIAALAERNAELAELKQAGTPYWKERDATNALVLEVAAKDVEIKHLREGIRQACWFARDVRTTSTRAGYDAIILTLEPLLSPPTPPQA